MASEREELFEAISDYVDECVAAGAAKWNQPESEEMLRFKLDRLIASERAAERQSIGESIGEMRDLSLLGVVNKIAADAGLPPYEPEPSIGRMLCRIGHETHANPPSVSWEGHVEVKRQRKGAHLFVYGTSEQEMAVHMTEALNAFPVGTTGTLRCTFTPDATDAGCE